MCQRVASLHVKGFIHIGIQPSTFFLFLCDNGQEEQGGSMQLASGNWKDSVTVKLGGTLCAAVRPPKTKALFRV